MPQYLKNLRQSLLVVLNKLEKQSFENVQQNRCSLEFCNIHRKTPVLESVFNKVALQHRCFLANITKFLRTAFL